MEAEKGCLGKNQDVYVVVESATKSFGSFFPKKSV